MLTTNEALLIEHNIRGLWKGRIAAQNMICCYFLADAGDRDVETSRVAEWLASTDTYQRPRAR
jgi:hypothetical protein